ncbi:hypothetical protein DOY81_008051 [Sarcophaga bullata]|nr:hypothetical protein DOY81_008051 [Sarcophaga bullata]
MKELPFNFFNIMTKELKLIHLIKYARDKKQKHVNFLRFPANMKDR